MCGSLAPLITFPPPLTLTHTHAAHTPDNSFMGFVSEELNDTEKRSIQQNKVNNMAVVYGKEASMWKVLTPRIYFDTSIYLKKYSVNAEGMIKNYRPFVWKHDKNIKTRSN